MLGCLGCPYPQAQAADRGSRLGLGTTFIGEGKSPVNLSTVFQAWRPYSPECFNEMTTEADRFTVQYKLCSKAYLDALWGYSKRELGEQINERPNIAEAFKDIHKADVLSQRIALTVHDHTGSVDNLTIDKKPITTTMELFAVLPGYARQALAAELFGVCQTARLDPEKKRSTSG